MDSESGERIVVGGLLLDGGLFLGLGLWHNAESVDAVESSVLNDGLVSVVVAHPVPDLPAEKTDLSDEPGSEERGVGVEPGHGGLGVGVVIGERELVEEVSEEVEGLVELVVWEEGNEPVESEGTDHGEETTGRSLDGDDATLLVVLAGVVHGHGGDVVDLLGEPSWDVHTSDTLNDGDDDGATEEGAEGEEGEGSPKSHEETGEALDASIFHVGVNITLLEAWGVENESRHSVVLKELDSPC